MTMSAGAITGLLGWEQMRALQIMKNVCDMEGSAICKAAGCSFDELFTLASMELIDIGGSRLIPKHLHPVLTNLGREVLELCEGAGTV